MTPEQKTAWKSISFLKKGKATNEFTELEDVMDIFAQCF